MSSFNRGECLGCGQLCDGYHYSCTCQQCGVFLSNGICLNCIYGDGKPINCCECEGPLRGGFCLFCDSKAKNSYTYDPNAFSFNNTLSNFNHLPQPQLCGNNSHYGYDCQPQFPFVYEQEPSYNQNYNDNYYPHDLPSCLCCDNCGGSHETFQCQPMDQNIDSFGFDQIQSPQYPVIHHLSQADIEEVLQDKEKFMQDTQTFLEKFNRYSFGVTPRVLSIAWERISKIKYVFTEPKEIPELMCKLREYVRNIRKELEEYINSPSWKCPIFFFFDDEEYSIQYKEYLEKSPDAVTTVLPTEEPEYSLSMGEYEVTSEDKRECGVPVCEDSSTFDVCEDHSEILFDSNNDDISSDDDVFEDIEYVEATPLESELVSLEEEIVDYQEEEDDHTEEMSSGSTTIHVNNCLPEYDSFCFEIEPGSGKLILAVINNIDELNEEECFDPGGEIDVFTNVEDDDYFPFIFVIRIFLPYLIYPEVSPLLLSAGSEDTIFYPGISV
nr:hypothetical protein [Tanacetum cinerariifolium]